VTELAVDGGPPRHTHTREDESFYVFSGVVDVECGQDQGRLCSCPATCRTPPGPLVAL
jgi:mannose-6-phosphate isomerase-like protein (cupin superfamily)